MQKRGVQVTFSIVRWQEILATCKPSNTQKIEQKMNKKKDLIFKDPDNTLI
jgi:hypothetical protein